MVEVAWDADSRRDLREMALVHLFMAKGGEGAMTFTELADSVAKEMKTSRERVYPNLRRFLFGHVQSPRGGLLDALLRHLVAWFNENRGIPDVKQSPYPAIAKARNWLAPARGRPKRSPRGNGPKHEAGELHQVRALADALMGAGGIDEQHFREASERLTGRTLGHHASGPCAGFITYRYGATHGNIVRSFTVVMPPTESERFCWFRNYYRIEGTGYERNCSGIVVQLHAAIYMLGVIGPREGLKLIMIPNASPEAKILSGLVATTTAQSKPLVSRVVFERTGVTHVDKLPQAQRPDVVTYPDSQSVLANTELKWRLRNHIAFEIGTEIYDNETHESIPAAVMKDLVRARFSKRLSLNGKPFNPADHLHYPFNQALVCYDAAERKGENVTRLGQGRKVNSRRRTTSE
jgi:hypothetical protein